MKRLAVALLLAACSDVAETFATAPCFWVQVGETQLRGDSCWIVTPPDGLSVTTYAANGCAAEYGQLPKLWPPRSRLKLWQRATDRRDLPLGMQEVACP